jgi:DNA mismatch endonuclease (patch repair protein)
MRANKKRDTRPELRLRRELHRRGLRYRTQTRIVLPDVTVRPDLVFPRQRVAVFVDGCFWHSCPEHGSRPRANSHYWEGKLERNRRRDEAVNAALEAHGWDVVRIWEHCEVIGAADLIERNLR